MCSPRLAGPTAIQFAHRRKTPLAGHARADGQRTGEEKQMADSGHPVSSELPPGVGEAAAAETAVAESTAAESAETQSVPDAALSATPLATLPTAEAETDSAATGAASAAPVTEPAGAAEPAGGGQAAAAGGINPPTTTTPETSGGGPRKPILAGTATPERPPARPRRRPGARAPRGGRSRPPPAVRCRTGVPSVGQRRRRSG